MSVSSRASVREQHRLMLSNLKLQADDRKIKSASIMSACSKRSVLSNAELDEDGDMPFPLDETKGKIIIDYLLII